MMTLVGAKKDFEIPEAIGEIIVRGIVDGNNDYANLRVRENPSLEVSDALAWARSNYIETGVANQIKLLPEDNDLNLTFRKHRSGYAWGYLRFMLNGENTLVILKPYKSDRNNIFSDKKLANSPQMTMGELTKINSKHFKETEGNVHTTETTLTVFKDNDGRAELKSAVDDAINFDSFLIVHYGVNENREIDQIKVNMPNYEEKAFYAIQDLTYLLEPFETTFTSEQISAVSRDEANEEFYNVSVKNIDEQEGNK